MRWLGILAILAYRVLIRPFRIRRCLYDESCSSYGIRMLRQQGIRSWRDIHNRIQSCRLPSAVCFVLDEHGKAQLLSAYSHDGGPPPAKALEILAARAELHAMMDRKLSD